MALSGMAKAGYGSAKEEAGESVGLPPSQKVWSGSVPQKRERALTMTPQTTSSGQDGPERSGTMEPKGSGKMETGRTGGKWACRTGRGARALQGVGRPALRSAPLTRPGRGPGPRGSSGSRGHPRRTVPAGPAPTGAFCPENKPATRSKACGGGEAGGEEPCQRGAGGGGARFGGGRQGRGAPGLRQAHRPARLPAPPPGSAPAPCRPGARSRAPSRRRREQSPLRGARRLSSAGPARACRARRRSLLAEGSRRRRLWAEPGVGSPPGKQRRRRAEGRAGGKRRKRRAVQASAAAPLLPGATGPRRRVRPPARQPPQRLRPRPGAEGRDGTPRLPPDSLRPRGCPTPRPAAPLRNYAFRSLRGGRRAGPFGPDAAREGATERRGRVPGGGGGRGEEGGSARSRRRFRGGGRAQRPGGPSPR